MKAKMMMVERAFPTSPIYLTADTRDGRLMETKHETTKLDAVTTNERIEKAITGSQID